MFAHLDSTDATELQGGIDIAVERYRQFRDLLGAFDRRARIERAKGLLMERHGIADGRGVRAPPASGSRQQRARSWVSSTTLLG